MYLYNSDIYRYLGNIKAEREKNYTMDSLFSPLVSKVLSTATLILTVALLIFGNIFPSADWLETAWVAMGILYITLIVESTVEIIRLYTNKADFSRAPIPKSLQPKPFRYEQRRCMKQYLVLRCQQLIEQGFHRGLEYASTNIGPMCKQFAKCVPYLVCVSEFAIPTATEGFGSTGPLTKYYINNWLYTDLAYPVQTKFDVAYEWTWHMHQQMLHDGVISTNPYKQRTINITNATTYAAMGGDLSVHAITDFTGSKKPLIELENPRME
jgi:hypothetical protein